MKKQTTPVPTGSTADFFADLKKDLGQIDPVKFAQERLTIRGEPFELIDCGRDYLYEIYRYACLEATGKDGMPMVISKGRQVEFTTTAAVMSAYLMCSGTYQNIQGLHAFPAVETARRHSNGPYDRLIAESVKGCLVKLKDMKTYSVTEKHYTTKNILYIDSTSKDGDRLRGLPIDFGIFDEIQDMTTAARENTQQALSHSVFGASGSGLELYFGTPKSAGSDFERLWESSDQRYFHLKCMHCGQVMMLTLENYKTGFMVECDYCKKMFDKRIGVKNGKWIPTRQEGFYRRGYHISQMLVPYITREAIERKREDLSPRAFQNEVLGQFYLGLGEAPTLPEIIEWTTKQPDSGNIRMTKSSQNITYMGIDWGARIAGVDDQGTGGYTIVVIVSVDELSKKFHIEFAHRMTTKNIEEQVKLISKWISEYNCTEVVADIGYGHAQCQRLQEQWSTRIKPCYSSGNSKKTYFFEPKTNMITVNKDRSVEELYDDIEQYKFVAPYKEPERIEWLFQQLANIEITSSTVNGLVRKKYTKQGPTKAIDAVMALMYARIAWKFRKTNAFREGLQGSYGQGRSMPIASVCGGTLNLGRAHSSSARRWAR